MVERPTAPEIRKARKAELVAWCQEFGLDSEGKVDELRGRLLEFIAGAEGEAVPPEPAEELKETPPAAEAQKESEEEEDEGEASEEEKAHAPKLKPTLNPSLRKLLEVRRVIASRRPEFHRQEWFRYRRFGKVWRKPQGMHSKLKRHFGYRPNVVSVGYRGPRAVRGYHPSGFREVRVFTTRELERVDPKVEAVRIAGTVGLRKRLEIQAAADEKGIRVLNRREEP